MNINDWITKRFAKAPVKKTESSVALKSTHEIIAEEVKLQKDIKDSDWAKIWMDHSESQHNDVDSTYHKVNSEIHRDYHKILHGTDKVYEVSPDASNGVSAKMIHKVGDNHFMTKPYHSTGDRDVPLAGWGIMTTRNLYHAGDLGHLVEDVGTTSVKRKSHNQDVPVTVHKFARDFNTATEFPRGGPERPLNFEDSPSAGAEALEDSIRTPPMKALVTHTAADIKKELIDSFISTNYKNVNNVNTLQVRQIGIMDFLTGNYDRHGNNLLMGAKESKDGRDLLAIDHDRAFSYLPITSPHSEYENSALVRFAGDSAGHKTDEHDRLVVSWWKNNKNKIHEEMNRNLNSIKNHQLRKYVRRNFDQRFQMISEWSDSYSDHKKSFFEKDLGSVISSYPLINVDEDSLNRVRESLPKNKSEALNMLFAYMKKPRDELPGDKLQAIQTIASDFLKEIPDAEAVKFFSKDDSDRRVRGFKNDVLMDMKSHPEKYASKMQHLLDVNSSLPPDSRFLNPFWDLHLRRTLNKFKSSKGVA